MERVGADRCVVIVDVALVESISWTYIDGLRTCKLTSVVGHYCQQNNIILASSYNWYYEE